MLLANRAFLIIYLELLLQKVAIIWIWNWLLLLLLVRGNISALARLWVLLLWWK